MKANQINKLLFSAVICLMCFNCNFIVSKMAFFPDRVDVVPTEKLPPGIDEITIPTQDHQKLVCYLIRNPNSKKLLIYFHGNAGNILHRFPDMYYLNKMNLNVLGVSYRGYAKSSGSPSEAGIYEDGKAVLKFATESLNFDLSRIIVFGRSIGSTVAVRISQSKNLAGVILVTPLTSGKSVARANGFGFFSCLAGQSFDNISRIQNITCPLLIIHGTRDEIVPFHMGQELYEKASTRKRFAKIEGATHNDISDPQKYDYWQIIGDFVNTL